MKSHYISNKELHSCIEIAFLSSVNPYDTVRQLSSLCLLCVCGIYAIVACHMPHESWGIFKWHCLFNCFLSFCSCCPFCSCTTRLLTNVQFIYAVDSRQTLKDDSLPRPHLLHLCVWHALKFNILTACTISS